MTLLKSILLPVILWLYALVFGDIVPPRMVDGGEEIAEIMNDRDMYA